MTDRPPSKRYVESLHARIRLLEEQLLSLKSAVQNDKEVEDIRELNKGEDQPPLEENDEETFSVSSGDDLLLRITDTCGRLNLDDDGQLRFFGPQSNYHLLHDHIDNKSPCSPGQNDISAQTTCADLIHIPFELQEHLIELYFRWQNPWVYIVEKDVFMRDFYNGNRNQYCTPLLLLSIFSLGARYSDRPEVYSGPGDLTTAGDAYAQRAKALLMSEIEKSSISTVQSAALLSIRWMAEDKEPAGWLCSGKL